MNRLNLIAALFILSINPLSAAQPQSPDLSVISTKIELTADYAADSRATQNGARATSVNPNDAEANSVFDRLGDINDRRAGKKYRLSILVRNNGPKTVRAVTLEYPLGYSRARTRPERVSFKFMSVIKPGEMRTIVHSFITSKHVILRSGEQAIIKKIVYSDGSFWRPS